MIESYINYIFLYLFFNFFVYPRFQMFGLVQLEGSKVKVEWNEGSHYIKCGIIICGLLAPPLFDLPVTNIKKYN
jgi:hypothetical protein